MDIEQRVIQALRDLNLIDPEIKIFDTHGSRILASVVSKSFDEMDDADRQAMIWGKLIDDLGEYDSRQVGYVITSTPEEVKASIEEANSVFRQI